MDEEKIVIDKVPVQIGIQQLRTNLENELERGVKMGLSSFLLEGLLQGLMTRVKALQIVEIEKGYQEIIVRQQKEETDGE